MKVIVQNLATEYEESGNGKTILLLHGWKNDLHSFDSIAQKLSETNHVIRVDLPGLGQTETPKKDWNLDDYVEFVNNFMSKLNLTIDTIIGHSFGARIIIKGVSTKQIEAERIVLIGGAGIAKNKTIKNISIKIVSKIGKMVLLILPFASFKKRLRKKLYTTLGSDYLDSGNLKETYKNIINEDLTENARHLAIPTLLIWGRDDSATPLADGQRFSKLISRSDLKVIENAGHFVHVEKPDIVSKYIQEFISEERV